MSNHKDIFDKSARGAEAPHKACFGYMTDIKHNTNWEGFIKLKAFVIFQEH